MMLRKIKQNYIVLILIFLSVLTILILQNFGFKSYSRYSTDTLHYDKGVVVEDFLMRTLNMIKNLKFTSAVRI